MDYTTAFAISAAGMNVERTRVDVAAMNLANANSIAGTAGAFRPLQVITQTRTFAEMTGMSAGDAWGGNLAETFWQQNVATTVPYARVMPTDAGPRMVYDPGHPSADSRGYVSYQGVDTATEMVSMMTAMRAYEANVAAMNVAKALAVKALEIGGTS